MRHDNDLWLSQKLIAAFDTPAFLRRANRVQAAWDQLLAECHNARDELLETPCWRLATLVTWPDWESRISAATGNEYLLYLRSLSQEWDLPAVPASFRWEKKFAELLRSFHQFNRQWETFLDQIDLEDLNKIREGYNRYYLIEKECALHSARTAAAGFQPLPPAGIADLRREFPLLRTP